MCVCVIRSVVSDSLQSHGLIPARFLCPLNSPGKTTGVGCHFLLQGIFPTPGTELVSPALAGSFFTAKLPGKPHYVLMPLLFWIVCYMQLNLIQNPRVSPGNPLSFTMTMMLPALRALSD